MPIAGGGRIPAFISGGEGCGIGVAGTVYAEEDEDTLAALIMEARPAEPPLVLVLVLAPRGADKSGGGGGGGGAVATVVVVVIAGEDAAVLDEVADAVVVTESVLRLALPKPNPFGLYSFPWQLLQ